MIVLFSIEYFPAGGRNTGDYGKPKVNIVINIINILIITIIIIRLNIIRKYQHNNKYYHH